MATWDPENNEDRFKRSLGTKIAGERNETESDGTDYQSVVNEATYTVVDLSDNSTTVSSTPAIFYGYYVSVVTSAHAVVVKDDTTAIITTVATAQAVGAELLTSGPGIRFETSLVVDPDDSATGTIIVLWREI